MPSPSARQPSDMLLRKLESIAAISGNTRRAVQELPFNVRTLRGAQDIVSNGDSPSQCCLLVEGWAFRYKLTGKGRRQVLSFDVPGDIPDLGGLHLPTMDYGLATLGGAIVAFIPHQSLRAMVGSYPDVAAILWRLTLVDSAVLREWIVGLGQRSACAHIAHLFCELYLRLEAVGLASGHRCSLPMTQAMLGDALGLSTVHVNRVLQELRGMGLITFSGQVLVIQRWDELRRVAQFDPVYLHLAARPGG